MSNRRKLYLDICDYGKNPIYSLYDNDVRTTGQAYNIIVQTERNGWRELSFSIPSVCNTESGEEPNEALEYLKNDFFIRLIDDYETDWFVISEPKVTHSGFAKTVNVTAGHISQQLRVKNLGLEFSDDEGNNTGTAEQLLTTILEGTGWTVGRVYDFKEKRDNTKTKIRSLKASTKTGAFKLISTMCDLFEAKPVYHGDTKTVDIVPINPFSSYAKGDLPKLDDSGRVIELHYGKNVRNVTRSMNSENIVTKLYAYGSFGDKTNGYCAIDQCTHTEYRFAVNTTLIKGDWYTFTVKDDSGTDITYRFKAESREINGATELVRQGDVLVYSLMDPSSMLYIWCERGDTGFSMPVYKGQEPEDHPLTGDGGRATVTKNENVKNWFSFIMDFDYYREIELMTDEMVEMLAEYQRYAPSLYQNIQNAATSMADKQTDLSKLIGSVDFCKLSVKAVGANDGYLTLELNTDEYKNGVIYRSDYDSNDQKKFNWRACETLNDNGDPTNTATSVVYIIRYKQLGTGETLKVPIWYKAYLRNIDDENDPSVLTLWLDYQTEVYPSNDEFYLFGYNAVNGYLGSLEGADEAAVQSIKDSLRIASQDHDVIFTKTEPQLVSTDSVIDYGWLWYYDDGSLPQSQAHDPMLFFCYKTEGDTEWMRVYFDDDETRVEAQSPEIGEYFYNWRKSILYRRSSAGEWAALTAGVEANITSAENVAAGISETKVASQFGTVYQTGQTRDRYYLGVDEQMIYTVPQGEQLPIGRYYFTDKYGTYYTFVTLADLSEGDTLTYYYMSEDVLLTGYVVQRASDTEKTLKVKNYRFDNVDHHPDNILENILMEAGEIWDNGEFAGQPHETDQCCRLAGYAPVYPDTRYVVDNLGEVTIHYYSEIKNWIRADVLTGSTFKTPGNARYIKYVYRHPLSTYESTIQNPAIHALMQGDPIVIENNNYYKLETVGYGETIGIIELMKRFGAAADETYSASYNAVQNARNELKIAENRMTELLGDIYKEGYWQDQSYIHGDEMKLYDDALDNLEKISYPETSYNIDFIDPYESNIGDADYCVAEETLMVPWEDYDISTAVHLVDPEIGINTWGFIDKIQKCYDKPYQSKIAINTNLTTIGQHSFADVMSNIADVANSVKGKISKYDTATGGYVTYANYDNLLSNLVTLTKVTERAGGRINEMQNDITGHSSQIIQTANMISSEVSRAIASEAELASKITQTEGRITATVSETVRTEVQTQMGYQAFITSNYGNFLSDSTPALTLTANARKGTQDVSSTIEAVEWTRVTGEENSDQTWNTAHVGNTTRTLRVTMDDLVSQATFIANVQIDGVRYSTTFSVANISLMGVLEVELASNLRQVQSKSIDNPPVFTPDWSDPQAPLRITPSVRYNGSPDPLSNSDPDLTIRWKKQYGDGTIADISAAAGERIVNGVLEVSKNTLDAVESHYISYVCYAAYNSLNAAAEKSYSLIQTTLSDQICTISGIQVFKYDSIGQPFYNTIDLIAYLEGCSLLQWQYRNANGDWIQYPGTGTGNSITVNEADPVFVNDNATIRVVTVVENDPGPTDIFTIHKVREGASATVFLTDESIVFRADQNGNVLPGRFTTNVVAYQGKTSVIPTLPENFIVNRAKIMGGMGISVLSPTADNEVPIEIVISGNNHNFGTSEDTSGFIEFAVDSPLYTTLRLNWTKTRSATEGIGSITTYYSKWYTNLTPPTRSKLAVFTPDEMMPYMGKDQSDAQIGDGLPIINSMVLGARGATVASNGQIISPYWSTTAPSIDSFEKYLWAYDVVTYVNGDVSVTDPRVIGAFGSSGMTIGLSMPDGEVIDRYTTELHAEAYVYSGVDDISSSAMYKWDYYYNGQWRPINESTRSHLFTLSWMKQNCPGGASIRCTVTYNMQEYFCYSTITDRTGDYQLVIRSSGGDVFYNGIGSATLVCQVYQDGAEMDPDSSAFDYSWTRLSSTGAALDTEPISISKSIQVTASPIVDETQEDVFRIDDTTTFVCFVRDKTGLLFSGQTEFTITYSVNIIFSNEEPSVKVPNVLWMQSVRRDDSGGQDDDDDTFGVIYGTVDLVTWAKKPMIDGNGDIMTDEGENIIYEPMLDEQGNQMVDEYGDLMYERVQAVDEEGNPRYYLDENGEPDLDRPIYEEAHEPLAGVTVRTLTSQTITNSEGHYFIHAPIGDATIVFTKDSGEIKCAAKSFTVPVKEYNEETFEETEDGAFNVPMTRSNNAEDWTISLPMFDLEQTPEYEVLYRWSEDKNDWTEVAVPQRTLNTMTEAIRQNNASIEILSDQITSRVEELSQSVTALGQTVMENNSTQYTQLSDSFNFTVSTQRQEINSYIQQREEERNVWMRFDENFLELGKKDSTDLEGSRFKTRLTNRELAFYEDEDKIAYINDNRLHITEARVTNTLDVGSNKQDMAGWFRYQMEPDGLAMVWKAEEWATYKFKVNVIYQNYNYDYNDFFLFVIEETDHNYVPLTSSRQRYSEVLSNVAGDYFYFKTLTFDAEGTRYFTIRQVPGGIYGDTNEQGYYIDPGKKPEESPGIVEYDNHIFHASVSVVKDTDGLSGYEINDITIETGTTDATTGQWVKDANGDVAEDSIVFTNIYTVSS